MIQKIIKQDGIFFRKGNAVLFFFILVISYGTSGQANKTVSLKWKLQPNEVLSYKFLNNELDSANNKDMSIDFEKFVPKHKESAGSGYDMVKDKISQLNKEIEKSDMHIYLSEQKKGIVNIEMKIIDHETDSAQRQDNIKDSMKYISRFLMGGKKGIVLRGSVYNTGGIESFYLKNDQRNLIALLFELPQIPVKVGDSWPMDVHLISMDQSFKCDSSYDRNKVTLTDLKKINGELIAFLKYDINEYVSGEMISPYSETSEKSMMNMTYEGVAQFSIDKGRWISYNCAMGLSSTGFMSNHVLKSVILVKD